MTSVDHVGIDGPVELAAAGQLTETQVSFSITPPMSQGEIAAIAERLRAFAHERNWERFHTPKNLAASVAIEAGELQEVFQWLSDEESGNLSETQLAAARAELADVAIYLVRLADVLQVDLVGAVEGKIIENGRRYPAGQVRGRAEKRP